jgi:hypothetical protein
MLRSIAITHKEKKKGEGCFVAGLTGLPARKKKMVSGMVFRVASQIEAIAFHLRAL